MGVTWSDAIADEIVERLTRESLRRICADDGMPHITTVIRHQAADQDFANRCAHARAIYIDSLVDETIDIADEAVPSTAMGSYDSGMVSDKKVRIAARQWYAEKLAPKRYGAKVEHDMKSSDGSMTPPKIITLCAPKDERTTD